MKKRGTRIEVENSGYILASFDRFKSEFLSKSKTVKYKDTEAMVYRLLLTYDEIIDILDVKYISGSTIGYTIPKVCMKSVILT